MKIVNKYTDPQITIPETFEEIRSELTMLKYEYESGTQSIPITRPRAANV
jgi:hypothetical protein